MSLNLDYLDKRDRSDTDRRVLKNNIIIQKFETVFTKESEKTHSRSLDSVMCDM